MSETSFMIFFPPLSQSGVPPGWKDGRVQVVVNLPFRYRWHEYASIFPLSMYNDTLIAEGTQYCAGPCWIPKSW